MDEAPHARQNAETFDPIAASYDRMGFLTETALHLVRCAQLRPGERVLDVATGTGTVALAAAERVGPSGTVTGVDLAESMLKVARDKAAGQETVTFQQADAARLPFADASFDAVLCASALFFMPDIPATLREWRRVLAPGGRVGFTGFAPGLMAPLPALWNQRLAAHGLTSPPLPFGRVPSPEAAQAMLLEAGFREAHAALDPLPYRIPDPQARWAEIMAGVEGARLASLDAGQQEQLRAEHLAELGGLFRDGPLEVRLPVIVALGRG